MEAEIKKQIDGASATGGAPTSDQSPTQEAPAAEKPAGFQAQATATINCETCNRSFTADDPYLPEKCGMDPALKKADHDSDGDTCPVDDVPPRINAADGRKSIDEMAAEHDAAAAEAERAEAARVQAEADAKVAEEERVRKLCPLPGDASDHGGLVQVTVKGDGETLSVTVADDVEVPRGFAVMVPAYVRDSLQDANLLA